MTQSIDEFSYELPEELIARFPAQRRSDSRLLALELTGGEISHGIFRDLPAFLRPEDLLVFNDTRVIPARLFGRKGTGGSVEVLIERVLADNRLLVQMRASKTPRPGSVIELRSDQEDESVRARVVGRQEEFMVLEIEAGVDPMQLLERIGHMPLPPYIKREDEALDQERYQTVYASNAGAVAAPTAGLHFDEQLLDEISALGVSSRFLTLHVGAGTFQPVRVDNIEEHKMHKELAVVSKEVVTAVEDCRRRGGRVIAVGTTSVRSLETAAASGQLQAFAGETDIFIYPGFEFKVVDAMITNFHLPRSTLLMLVSAFAGKKMLLDAYASAIAHRYRFFSYGDAMLLYRDTGAQ